MVCPDLLVSLPLSKVIRFGPFGPGARRDPKLWSRPRRAPTRLILVDQIRRICANWPARARSHLTAGVVDALHWFVHEFLLFGIRPATGSRLASLCRLLGCLVLVVILRLELRNGLLPDTTAAIIQLGVAVLTALLVANIAKEFSFDVCARLTMWSGCAFVRKGLTVGGTTFWEIQFRDGTWMRYEMRSTGTSCEWTDADGRCNRVDLQSTYDGGP